MNNAPFKPKKKKCIVCKDPYMPFNSLQKCCTKPSCAIATAKKTKEKEDDKHWKERGKALEKKPKLEKRTQTAFNAFIRERDFYEPCISCGRYDREIDYSGVGGKWDCGHFLTVGAHPELRFTESNGYKQCKSCNAGSGKYTKKNHTVGIDYRINLIARIGIEKVEWLEGPHEPLNLLHDDLRDMAIQYREKTRQLKKIREDNE